ncbi:hypothetical protein ULMS_25500 [Patiriisocius marinistellae]|uniref:Bulb-type lectin domain-containing protein n=1 Tax=Patiriisocius marinistellae TaxID=2494560 RepID=A0A5J4G0F4_9FLAO|nr:hypothetical protein [Patiriisocius marinistellae]GEQ87042.1 hypothetical protein ULMS_25500 [Patiriisocius marinistellae]
MEVATFELTSSGQNDFFIAKYDLNNQLLWAVNFGNDNLIGYTSMILDTNDDIYVTDSFYETMDMDPSNGISNITSNGDQDFFYKIKYRWTIYLGLQFWEPHLSRPKLVHYFE